MGTKLNPADIASRGAGVRELSTMELWWNGPRYLLEPKTAWPTKRSAPLSDTTAHEMKIHFNFCNIVTPEDTRLDPVRFSSLSRLKRVWAWTIRFLNNSRRQGDRLQGELTVEELADSEQQLIRIAQVAKFPEEIKQLTARKQISSQSKLISLQPFMDEDGIVRANSRLQHPELPFEVKCPIILPRKGWITKLIVREAHNRDGHAKGTNHTLATLSNRFWISKGREAIEKWRVSATPVLDGKPSSALS